VTSWLQLDRDLFYLINHSWANPFFDVFFPWITKLKHFLPVLVPLILVLVTLGRRRGRLCVLTLGLSIAVSDPLTVRVLQPSFERVRPCVALSDTRLLVSRKKSPSFPSAHAVNVFAAAAVLWRFYRRSLWASLPLAVLVALSRVYVGVHYPLDILAGAILGWVVGLLVERAVREVSARLDRRVVPESLA
jgi:undecaprenyl-diphosphatase